MPTKKSTKHTPPRKLTSATLMHFTVHLEANLVRANVQQDLKVGGGATRHGRDVDIALDDAGADIRKAIDALAQKIGQKVGARVYYPSV